MVVTVAFWALLVAPTQPLAGPLPRPGQSVVRRAELRLRGSYRQLGKLMGCLRNPIAGQGDLEGLSGSVLHLPYPVRTCNSLNFFGFNLAAFIARVRICLDRRSVSNDH
jgi:hypothetical protein